MVACRLKIKAMNNKLYLIVILLFTTVISFSFINCKKEEQDLVKDKSDNEIVNIINDYRVSKGLSKIPISPSLNKVAALHVKDLADNHPDNSPCNLHSWSDKGSWSSCCYTPDHAKASCMWNKPRELTSYKGDGYEIAAWSSNNITAKYALEIWKSSSGHHNVIINASTWSNHTWKAIGGAIYKGYAVVWFGKEEDPEKN